MSTPIEARGLRPLEGSATFGFTPLDLVSPANFLSATLALADHAQTIASFCSQIEARFQDFGWREKPCGGIKWRADLRTRAGHPLIYTEFGSGPETTLLLGGVHPDEITPIPIAFRIARHLAENPDVIERKNVRVIVAPLVNPDGFLRKVPARTNTNGIDLNRNFFTLDWYAKAKKLWVERRRRAASHFPGYFPNSEIETLFQIRLIDELQPDKILSIHAPLGFLDYDGPGDGLNSQLTPKEQNAKDLVQSISEKSQNYKVVDFTFYPGSLGNYAGQERHIPTVTLELETTNPRMLEPYWRQFLPGILQSIHFPFTKIRNAAKIKDASPFSAEYVKSGQSKTI